MKKLLIFIGILIPLTAMSQTQATEDERMVVVRGFLHDIFYKPAVTWENLDTLARKYIYLESQTDTDSIYRRQLGVLGYLVEYFRKDYKATFDEKKAAIWSYNRLLLLDDVKKFDPFIYSQKDIYGVLSNKKIMMYILFKQNRIVSFFPIMESQEGYSWLGF